MTANVEERSAQLSAERQARINADADILEAALAANGLDVTITKAVRSRLCKEDAG